MEHFNEVLYNKAIEDFKGVVNRTLPSLKEELGKLEIELDDEIWQDFVMKGSSNKIKEIALGKLQGKRSIYEQAPDQAPINRILTQIQNLKEHMGDSYHRPSRRCELISLQSYTLDGNITQSALENLKAYCTDFIDDDVHKALGSFIKAHDTLKKLIPGDLFIDSRYLLINQDGSASISYNNL